MSSAAINHYSAPSSYPSSKNQQTSSTAPSVRTRITRACDHCQLRKTKCDSTKPRCSQCVKRGDPCTFTTKVCKRGPKPKRYTNETEYSITSTNQQFNKKSASTNVFPYPSYFPVNTQTNIYRSDVSLKPNYAQQASTQNYKNLTQSYSEFLASESFNSQRLPPIQTSSSSPLLPSSPATNNSLTLPSLRLPSLSNTFKLPPISALLNGSSVYNERQDFEKVNVSSPSCYKLNQSGRIPLRY